MNCMYEKRKQRAACKTEGRWRGRERGKKSSESEEAERAK